MRTQGKTLKVFVMGNSSNSMKSIELVNWTGLAFFGERQHIQAARARDELCEPAIYLLLSDNTDNALLTDIYIGETDDFSRRIVDHAQTKDWWDRFIVFVSKDQNLTKAHVKFLEKELHRIAAGSIGNLKVRNSQDPGGASLPESDICSMMEFLGNMQFVLETLGLSYFSRSPETGSSEKSEQAASPGPKGDFYITLPRDLGSDGNQLRSEMMIRDGSYILKKGSFVRAEARDSFATHDSYHKLWKQIVSSNVVVLDSKKLFYVTTQDIEFRSPSAAAAVVRAAATNGRVEWKRVSDDLPLNKCEAEDSEQVPAA